MERLNLGTQEQDAGDLAAALVDIRAAARGLSAVSGGRSPTLQAAWVAEAGVLSALGHNREALALVARVDPVAYQATTSDPGRAAVLKALHAQILLRLGRRDEGLPQLREALAQMQSQGVSNEEMASFRQSLGPPQVASK